LLAGDVLEFLEVQQVGPDVSREKRELAQFTFLFRQRNIQMAAGPGPGAKQVVKASGQVGHPDEVHPETLGGFLHGFLQW
jgi:hypothetical protein